MSPTGTTDCPDLDWEVGFTDWPLSCSERRSFLRGIVDMGSNGIRFSVSDLSPPTSRILPTLYVNRVDISLYDSQFDPDSNTRIPIPSDVIESVCAALFRFQIVCKDLGVPEDNIRVIATEATRTAINSKQFLHRIQQASGLSVEVISKEDEGRTGALGISSGFSDIAGISMDLGGGSTQITWLISRAGNLRISPKGSFSFPYGAAALTQKLEALRKDKSKEEGDRAVAEFRNEMKQNFIDAHDKLQIPQELVDKAIEDGGYQLYLSGGGFRGWGYLLLYMNQVHGQHYPISIINGFSVPKSQFEDSESLTRVAHTAQRIFRISDRRRSQVPSVAFLVNALAGAFPRGFKEVHFCQGGIREGILFKELSPLTRSQDPLDVATRRFSPQSASSLYGLILACIPEPSDTLTRTFPKPFNHHVIQSFINVLYVHAVMSKETASTAALYSTSAGLMSTTHGVSHTDRARLALLLEERYQGEIPPREVLFKLALQSLLTPEEVWWTRYLGKIGLLFGKVYPAGAIDEFKPRVITSAQWSNCLGKKKNKQGIELVLSIQKVENDPMKLKEALEDHVDIIEKVGKRKNWIGGVDGWGMAVQVKVVEEDIVVT